MKEVRAKLKELKDDFDNGIELGDKYTFEEACRDFLARGLPVQGGATVDRIRCDIENHIIPGLGKAKLKRLTADDIDDFLEGFAKNHATSTVRRVLGTIRRIIRRAQRRNKVARNVAELVEAPKGKKKGRPSKALTLEQGKAIIRECRKSREAWIHAYVALSMFTGVRTEEARPLKWAHTHLNPVKGEQCSCGRIHRETLPPHVEVWRSVRVSGDTKTEKSRRTVALPAYVVRIMTEYRVKLIEDRKRNHHKWEGLVYVFGTRHDTVKESRNVRRFFKAIVAEADIEGEWAPRELRHTFVSWMSDQGARDELIADLVGHRNTTTTRLVYRKQLRPVITTGAELLDEVFGEEFSDEG